MKKETKQKTGTKKVIQGKPHTCRMGATVDPRFRKCYFCPRIDKVK